MASKGFDPQLQNAYDVVINHIQARSIFLRELYQWLVTEEERASDKAEEMLREVAEHLQKQGSSLVQTELQKLKFRLTKEEESTLSDLLENQYHHIKQISLAQFQEVGTEDEQNEEMIDETVIDSEVGDEKV